MPATNHVTALPTPAPNRGMDSATFTTAANNMVAALGPMVTEINDVTDEVNDNADSAASNATVALAASSDASNFATNAANSAATALNAPGTQATSTTSMTIGTGSKSFTLAQTGKAFVVNQFVIITNSATNWMAGIITAFNSGSGAITVNVTGVSGSGTLASWTVTPNAPFAAVPFSTIEVLNISSDTSLTSSSKNLVRVASTVRASSVKLPSATTLTGVTSVYTIKNIGEFALPVRDQDGTLLSILPKNSTGIYSLEDGSTSAGVWAVVAPDSYPAIAFTAATVEAATVTWMGISEIPGVANKALIAWIAAGNAKVAIATRNTVTNAVTVGAALTLSAVVNLPNRGIVKALTSTTALFAGTTAGSQDTVHSLSLNTGTDTVTTTGNATFGGNLANGRTYEHVQQLDSTRIAWLSLTNTPFNAINIATYATTPSAVQTSLVAANLDHNRASIVHVGGGNIIGVSATGAAVFTTSGNTPTLVSTSTAYANTMVTNSQAVGFAPLAANRATFFVSTTTGSPLSDYTFTITPSGTTLPLGPNAASIFPSSQFYSDGITSFVAGTSYCVLSGVNANGSLHASYLRVMRYTDAQLLETVCGGVEGFPMSIGLPIIRAASVSGQVCIVINPNRSSQPQVFSMEVIKA